MSTLYVGTSGVQITIDTMAGTPGAVPNLTGATCTLVVSLNFDPRIETGRSRVQIPTNRFTTNGDGRTFTYTVAATDIPYPGTYSLQLIAEYPSTTLLSLIGSIVVTAAI